MADHAGYRPVSGSSGRWSFASEARPFLVEFRGMNVLRWLLWGLVAVGAVAALISFDRLCLWLEDRGWLYYRRKKPSSSPASSWVALQQFIEPGVKHVIQIKQEKRSEEDEKAGRERLFACLLVSLGSTPAPVEEIRFYLTAAKNAGIDWRELYEEVKSAELSNRPDRAALIPSPDSVAPLA